MFTKWVQKLTHTCITLQQTKIRQGYLISALTDAMTPDISGSFRLVNSNDTELIPVLEDEKVICSSEEQERKDPKEHVESEVTNIHIDGEKQNPIIGCLSPLHVQHEDQTFLGMNEGSCIAQSPCPQAFPHAVEGNDSTEKKDSLKAQQRIQCTVEIIPSKNYHNKHTLETKDERHRPTHYKCYPIVPYRIDGSSSGSYINPCIQTRLMQIQGLPVEHELIKCQNVEEMLAAKSSGISKQLLSSPDLDQLANAKQLGILICSVQQNLQTVSSSRSTRGLRLKETERTSIPKVLHSKVVDENLLLCDICSRPETLLNRIFICSIRKVAVHLDCYCKLTDPIGLWKCNVCENVLSGTFTSHLTVECVLCGGGGKGAFRNSTEGQWVHAFCAEWLLEAMYRRGQQNLVEGVDEVTKAKNLTTCTVCKQKNGVCLKCNHEHCQATFHPTCARAAGFFMDVKIVGGSLHHKAYCDKHSMQQRQKAEDQQYSNEEFKGIKQMRFELEKLRILCERIVRREKIKKELVLCSHAVLASKKDCLAFTLPVRRLIRRPISMSGVSSESDTTSIDNKSYSGTNQRSENVTVQSTLSSKSRSRISFETDGKNDDTTSKPSSKRKIGDRTSCSGKQLPHRIKVLNFQCSGDGGKKLNAIKASAHNKLEKGFVYVPINPLSEVKAVLHESEEPGG